MSRQAAISDAMLCAFNLLEFDGHDLRTSPLDDREKRSRGCWGAASIIRE
jgi:ATP-dependent DNA ligase